MLTMLPPKDWIGVSCATETNGAALLALTAPGVMSIVPRKALSTGVGAAVKLTSLSKTVR